jgi:ABC-2 type transport system permease protein
VRARRFWSNVLAVAYRESLVVRHDKAFLGIVLAQPVMMLILFGIALSNKPANVNWAVLDRSRTTASRRLIADVEATGYFLRPQAVESYATGREMLRRRQALLLVVVPRDFRRDLDRGHAEIQVLLDGSDPLAAARIAGYVGGVASVFRLREHPARDRPPRVDPVLGPIDVRQRFWFNPTLDDHAFFLSALAGMLLTNLCLSVTSLGLVGERESGTYEQLLAQPTTSVEIVLGKVAPYVAVAFALMLGAVTAAGLFFGVWPRGSWIALCVVTLPFVLASLAIGVLVSALARSSAQAVFITVFFIMPSFVLSGVMFPYQLMPHGVREVGGVLPLRWYQISLRRVIERGAGLGDVVVPFVALSVIFGLLLAVLRWRMKPRLG